MNGRMGVALCGAVAICALAACGGGNKNKPGAGQDTATAPKSAVAPETTSAQGAQAAAAQKPLDTTAVEAAPKLTVGTAGGATFLADNTGRPLYMFTADKPGASSCNAACAKAWPPMTAPQGAPAAGSADVKANLLGTLTRPDGSKQVTYNGHPLYYFPQDQGSTAPRGNGVKAFGGEWYVLTPAGDKLEPGGGASAGGKQSDAGKRAGGGKQSTGGVAF